MTMGEQLFEVGSKLPPLALVELLDFAEFLRQRSTCSGVVRRLPLVDLRGGLEDSISFSGEPLAIQEAMRRDWN